MLQLVVIFLIENGETMPRQKHTEIEYRDYDLPADFPVILLTGEIWRISDIRSNRLHFHNCLELGLCETDSGIMEFSENVKSFNSGDMTFVGSNIVHTTYSTPGTASKWSYVFVDLESLLAPYFPVSLFLDEETLSDMTHNFYTILPTEKYPVMVETLRMIIRELEEKKKNYQISVRGLFLSLLVHIMQIYNSGEISEAKQNQPSQDKRLAIAPALEYIHSNFMHDFTIEELAAMCGMSMTHFRRRFLALMGTNPLDYLNAYRISRASMLLRSTDQPVLTISEEVGFGSISSFNRHFSQIMGVSPLKWRQQMSFIKNKSVFKYTGWMVPEK